MRQILHVFGIHYDVYDDGGVAMPWFELGIDVKDSDSILCKRGEIRTERYHLPVDKLKTVIQQLQGMVEQAEKLREECEQ